MESDNIAIIRNIYELFGTRQYEAVLKRLDPDLIWIAADSSPLADRSPYRGTAELREGVFARIAAGYEKLTVAIDEIFAAGDKVVVLGYYEGMARGKSEASRTQLAHIWTLANGKPVKFQQYLDTLRVAESFR
jgi:ketosteroid isomerase-like protein